MKRLILIILLSGTFLGGYQLGRVPNSPDLIAKGTSVLSCAKGVFQWAEALIRHRGGRLVDRGPRQAAADLADCGQFPSQFDPPGPPR